MSARGELDPLVSQFQHESHRKRAAEALHSLQKIASIVKPIMRQRNWFVGTLAEFYPPEHNLLGLNINRGQKICLRLRYPGDENQFLPLEQVVDTMLHELCHIVHGPHDQHFHKLWDQLRDEHESLLRKGYTGEGFLGQGNRLGGRRIPMAEARRKARAAAEKRRTLTSGSGQRLGGAPVMHGQDIRKTIVEAIERRNKIEKGCASGTDTGRKIAREVEVQQDQDGTTVTQAEEDDANEAAIMQAYIEMIQQEEREKYGDGYLPPTHENPAGPRQDLDQPPLSPRSLRAQQASIEQGIRQTQTPSPVPPAITKPAPTRNPSLPPRRPSPPPRQLTPPATWTCEICTLVNPIEHLACDACTTERPSWISELYFSPPPLDSFHPSNPQNHNGSNPRPPTGRDRPNALKPRLTSTEALRKFEAEAATKTHSQPIGWTCRRCDNFMGSEWWTCSVCGQMKESS